MDTLGAISAWIARLMDYPLGWLLALPRDLAIALLAVGTCLLLALARKLTTDQDRLRRCRGDIRRLRALIRQARRQGEKATVRRLRATRARVNTLRLGAEAKPLAVSIVPIVVLAVWAVARLDYLPPRVGEELTLRAFYPLSSVDRLTHLVPRDGVELPQGAVRVVELDPEGEANGLASWALRPAEPLEGTRLLIRHRGQTAEHPLRAGARTYAPPLVAHGGPAILVTELELRRARFLGLVPGIPALGFPPWLVAYLLLVVPLVPLVRRLLRVY
ncbi:MAG: hypothetical protein ACLF0G_14470 [Candidatus Brocadiia bacterium]